MNERAKRAGAGCGTTATLGDGIAAGGMRGATASILLVDDDARNLMGLSVIEAEDAGKALEILGARDDVRLLFTDIMMPGKNGTALAAEALKRRPDLKVLYATGCDEQDCATLPAEELLRKPYRAQELALRIRSLLATG